MKEKFNKNLRKALESSQHAVDICKQAMIEANDESCRALYSAIKKDCEKHIEMLNGEIDLHIHQKKWEEE
jgi:hypothetical protein